MDGKFDDTGWRPGTQDDPAWPSGNQHERHAPVTIERDRLAPLTIQQDSLAQKKKKNKQSMTSPGNSKIRKKRTLAEASGVNAVKMWN